MSATLLVGVGVVVAFAFTMREMGDMIRVTLFGSRNNAVDGSNTAFDPAKDIPSLAGKVVLITGGAGGLGFQAVVELARYGRPARIYIADLPRDVASQKDVLKKAEREAYENEAKSVEDPQTEFKFLDLDLASFESVRRCAASFASQEQRLDILFLNAGIIRVPPLKTTEGYEIHFGINYLGHALLSRLLMPTLLHTAQQQPEADVRVIVLSSEGHVMAPKQGIDFDKVKTDGSSIVRKRPTSEITTHC
jgi:NAD(P)-dependent dehydrogenase (short-subunit alcohol dehydrogenase family)